MYSQPLTGESISAADALIIVTDHSNLDYGLILEKAKLVIDSRNATAKLRKPHHNVVLA